MLIDVLYKDKIYTFVGVRSWNYSKKGFLWIYFFNPVLEHGINCGHIDGGKVIDSFVPVTGIIVDTDENNPSDLLIIQ